MKSFTEERTDYIERTRQAREASGKSQADVAKFLGIERTTYTGYEISRPMPGKYAAKFCEITDVNEQWLISGRGPMKDEGSDFLAIMKKIDDPVLQEKLKSEALRLLLERGK